jgi:hypothetical protein
MERSSFQKLNKAEKYRILKERGKFLASRMHGGFTVGLFGLDGFYVEVWKRIGLDYIDYIEVVMELSRLDLYTQDINLPDFLA